MKNLLFVLTLFSSQAFSYCSEPIPPSCASILSSNLNSNQEVSFCNYQIDSYNEEVRKYRNCLMEEAKAEAMRIEETQRRMEENSFRNENINNFNCIRGTAGCF